MAVFLRSDGLGLGRETVNRSWCLFLLKLKQNFNVFKKPVINLYLVCPNLQRLLVTRLYIQDLQHRSI